MPWRAETCEAPPDILSVSSLADLKSLRIDGFLHRERIRSKFWFQDDVGSLKRLVAYEVPLLT